jgi:hypothetical protein
MPLFYAASELTTLSAKVGSLGDRAEIERGFESVRAKVRASTVIPRSARSAAPWYLMLTKSIIFQPRIFLNISKCFYYFTYASVIPIHGGAFS